MYHKELLYYITNVALNKNIMEATILEAPEVMEQEKEIAQKKKKSLWDCVLENKKTPLPFTIEKEAEDLIFGSNMWVKLMQEEVLDEE